MTFDRPPPRFRARCAAALAGALLAASGCGRGPEGGYPSRSTIIICPWGAGGGTDLVSRFIARLLEEETGASYSVVNRTGGGGVTGHAAGALARPNGYTILTITVEIAMMHHRGLTSFGPDDYEPLLLFNRDSAALLVRADSPWHSAKELLADSAANPGSLRGTGTAIGGIWHLGLTGLLLSAGQPADAIKWVPSTGAGPSIQELLSDTVHCVVASLPEARAQLDAGQLRCLGIMAKERLPSFPDVPTMIEQGIDWTLGGWRGMALPLGTPPEIVAKLGSLLQKVLRSDEFSDFMEKNGFTITLESAEQFRETMKHDDEKFRDLLAASITDENADTSLPGPWFFPAVISVAIVLVGLGLAIRCLPARGQLPNLEVTRAQLLILEVVGLVIVYCVASNTLGFLITAAAIVGYLAKRLGNSWLVTVTMTIVLVPGIYLLFGVFMRVPLPRGVLPW